MPAAHPLEVLQFGYRVRLVNPPAGDRRAAFDVYEAATARHVYEGQGSDPRVAQSLALDVDEYGHVRLSLTVEHARRLSIPADAPAQTRPIVKATEASYLNADEADRHELGLRVQSREFEIAGLPADGVALLSRAVGPAVVSAIAAAKPFAESFTGAGVEARVSSWERNIYWGAGLAGAAPLGSAGAPALLHHVEQAAFTPAFAAAALPPGVDTAVLQSDGHYDLRDGYWWASDPVQHYGTAAQFRRLVRTVRADGSETALAYDQHTLLVTRMVDAAGSAVAFEFDYHHLLPWRTTDANGARTEVRYDALGVAIASTHVAQVLDGVGTDQPYGFAPIASFSPSILLDVLGNPSFFLQDAATACSTTSRPGSGTGLRSPSWN